MGKQFSATTDDGGGPILSAAFWNKGRKLTGGFTGVKPVRLPDNTESAIYQFICIEPKELELKLAGFKLSENGEVKKVDRFAMGNLTQFEMAIDGLRVQSLGQFTEFQFRDLVTIECIDVIKATKAGQSDSPKFKLSIERA